ncbi:MAG: sensory histidine kinase AtoS [Methanoregula sp. PtaU1.Bin051]|nr:MAG: sensory histidine kinase AtoS [Methanoregula sp. PtaU1.Bin051]
MSAREQSSTAVFLYRNYRYLVISGLTVLAFAVNLSGILVGVTVILSHVFYFPIIVAAYWYPRRGLLFSACIAMAYGLIFVSFAPMDYLLGVATVSRMLFFVLIGGVVSLLSSKLRQSEQQLHDIIEFLPDATFAISDEGAVIAWNRAMEEMTGVLKEEILGKSDYAYSVPFYDERRPILADLILKDNPETEKRYPFVRRESGRIISEIFIPRLRGGKGAHLRIAATALIDSDGNVCGAIESIRDITDRILTASALKNASSRLNTIAGIIRLDLAKTLAVLYGRLSVGVMKFNDPEVLSFIDGLKRSVDGVQRQIEISRVFRDIGADPPAWQQVQPAINDAISKLGCKNATFGIWTERLEVFGDPNLPTAFYHILYYYLKDQAGPVRVVATYKVLENRCRILLEVTGPGVIVAPGGESLFAQWNERSGYGLYLAHEILAITNMAITENAVAGKVAGCEIVLPPEGYRITGWRV